MKRVLRVVVALSVAALVTLGIAGTAGAQSYEGATLTASSTSVSPGGEMTVGGTNWLPNSTVTVTVASTPTVVGTPMTDANGDWSLTFAAPTEPGAHTVTATDGVNTLVLSFTVSGAAAATTSGALPYTGNDSSLPLAQLGAGLLAVGAVVMLTVRRRHQLTPAKVES